MVRGYMFHELIFDPLSIDIYEYYLTTIQKGAKMSCLNTNDG